jgi:tetratricopeptide (TPR) repeat protein
MTDPVPETTVDLPKPPGLVRRVLAPFRRAWFRAALLISFAVIVHIPALSGEMIWDDSYLARSNPFIKSPLLAWETFRHHLFLDSYSGHYRPVQNLSMIVDYFFWNDNTYGFHLTNVLLHAGGGVLLFFLLCSLFKALNLPRLKPATLESAAFLIALLWVVHPVHSAAIDYISGRADSLAFLFAAAGWLLFFRAQEAKRRVSRVFIWVLAAIAALLGLCSRETGSLWLIIFSLFHLGFDRRTQRPRKLTILLVCLALFSIYGGLRGLPESRQAATGGDGWSYPFRSVLMLRALGDYGRLMVLPTNLHMERSVINPHSYETHSGWQEAIGSEYLSVLGLAVAIGLILGCRLNGPGQKMRVFGAVWFLVSFLPVSNLFDLNATVAEHWLYLPSVGLLLFAAGLVLDLPAHARPMLVGATGLAVLALSIRSAQRSSDWATPERFFTRTLAAGGDSARVRVNLGQLYAQRGEYVRAEKIFREILTRVPKYPLAEANLASSLFHQGRRTEAEALFASAAAAATEDRKDYPRTWLSAVNLAGMQRQAGDTKGAIKLLERTRADYPDIWEIVSLESEILRQTQGPAAAFDLVADFSRTHWWHYESQLALGRLYAEAGNAEAAVIALRMASRLDVHEVEGLNLIAMVRLRQHRLAEAYGAQKQAVSRQPDSPSQYQLLSNILEQMGQSEEAKLASAKVERLKAIGRQPRSVAN